MFFGGGGKRLGCGFTSLGDLGTYLLLYTRVLNGRVQEKWLCGEDRYVGIVVLCAI